jgi:hypothetical protein
MEKYTVVNPAKEDQQNIYFICADCGCLVRSDFTDQHDSKCSREKSERPDLK